MPDGNLQAIVSRIYSGPTLPPVDRSFHLRAIYDEEDEAKWEAGEDEPESIAAFACVIEYKGEQRFITCKKLNYVGESGRIFAVCHNAGGPRTFLLSEITMVADAYSGEILGDGNYFYRFATDGVREAVPSWGLSSGRKALLVAGLNVLAFMARCDGRWHPLENEPIEKFVCSLWLRKEWEGDPDLDAIMAHVQRLTPDSETFFTGLNYYARSRTCAAVLRQAVANLIEADGVVCADECDWSLALSEYLMEQEERPCG